jgi:formylglycine-generating enzyme required for sulfatase activity
MNIKLVLALTLLSVSFASQFTQAQLSLGIQKSNNQTVLYWTNPSNGTNCVLISASSLIPSNWATATDAVPFNYNSKTTALSVPGSAPVRLFRLTLVPPASDGMALIPAGSYAIGDIADTNYSADAAPTNVYTSAFYIETNLVSYSKWQSVFQYAALNGYSFDNSGAARQNSQSSQPVETNNWYDVVKWCNARSQQAGLTPVYYTDSGFSHAYTNGDTDTVYANWSAAGYRLPTEAEWEKAARGGMYGHRFPWGDTISETQANYSVKNSLQAFSYNLSPDGYNPTALATGAMIPYTTPVATFPPNGYGLCDMAGNLEEWCWDWYNDITTDVGSAYAGGSDPHGTGPNINNFDMLQERVLRGGAWNELAVSSRCANRSSTPPSSSSSSIGFRCVRKY